MKPQIMFLLQMALGYVAWLLCLEAYFLPKIREIGPLKALRAIALLNAFRYFGMVIILPGVVGPGLPPDFGPDAAFGDLLTALLAILALLTWRSRPLFLFLSLAFNLVGIVDLLVDYFHAIRGGLPQVSGQLGGAYWVPVIYVPLLMITHILAFRLLMQLRTAAAAPTGAGA
jgi:hypothetical protein